MRVVEHVHVVGRTAGARRRLQGLAVAVAAVLGSSQLAMAQAPNPLVGRYDGRWGNDEIEVTLRAGLGGTLTLSGKEQRVVVAASESGPPRRLRGKLVGQVLGEQREVDFSAVLENPTTVVLTLTSAGETYRLTRQGGGGRNPLAPSGAGGGGGGQGWPGTFASGEQASLVIADQFEGELTTNGAAYPLIAVEATHEGTRRLEGRFRVGDDLFDFTAAMSGRSLVLETGGAQHTLERRGDAPAPRPAAGSEAPAAERGIVVLKNGEVFVGPIVAESQTDITQRTARGELRSPKARVRWFSRETSVLTDAYWSQFENEVVDSAWEQARERWRQSHAPAAAAQPAQPNLSNVRAGQRWVFRLQQGLQMVYTVRAVDSAAGTVSYSMQSVMNGSPVGDPTFAEWGSTTFAEQQAQAGQPQAKTSRQRLRVAGREFDCLVTQVPGATSWVPMSGDSPTFPGVIKSADGAGVVVLELERIE